MIRKCFVMQLNQGAEEEYRRRHDPIWNELEERKPAGMRLLRRRFAGAGGITWPVLCRSMRTIRHARSNSGRCSTLSEKKTCRLKDV
jgi:hypothetical protein